MVVIDEIHLVPALFEALPVITNTDRYAGHRIGRLHNPGSAAIDLLKQCRPDPFAPLEEGYRPASRLFWIVLDAP